MQPEADIVQSSPEAEKLMAMDYAKTIEKEDNRGINEVLDRITEEGLKKALEENQQWSKTQDLTGGNMQAYSASPADNDMKDREALRSQTTAKDLQDIEMAENVGWPTEARDMDDELGEESENPWDLNHTMKGQTQVPGQQVTFTVLTNNVVGFTIDPLSIYDFPPQTNTGPYYDFSDLDWRLPDMEPVFTTQEPMNDLKHLHWNDEVSQTTFMEQLQNQNPQTSPISIAMDPSLDDMHYDVPGDLLLNEMRDEVPSIVPAIEEQTKEDLRKAQDNRRNEAQDRAEEQSSAQTPYNSEVDVNNHLRNYAPLQVLQNQKFASPRKPKQARDQESRT